MIYIFVITGFVNLFFQEKKNEHLKGPKGS